MLSITPLSSIDNGHVSLSRNESIAATYLCCFHNADTIGKEWLHASIHSRLLDPCFKTGTQQSQTSPASGRISQYTHWSNNHRVSNCWVTEIQTMVEEYWTTRQSLGLMNIPVRREQPLANLWQSTLRAFQPQFVVGSQSPQQPAMHQHKSAGS